RLHVAGHVELGHHHDVAFAGVGDDVADLVLGVPAAVRAGLAGIGVGAGLAGRDPAAADLHQLRVLRDLDPPALVVGQVPVQYVELVPGHRVDQLLDLVDRLEVPCRVEHQPAPGKARRVL